MRQFRFRALITLYPADPHSVTPDASSPRYPNRTLALVVLARPLLADDGPARYFPTEISWDSETPLRPGDRALVTVKVSDDRASDYLAAGQPFTLWSRGQVGHGTVVRKISADGSRP